jgi:hypothetical protein
MRQCKNRFSQMTESVDSEIKEEDEKIHLKKEFNKEVFFTFNELIV